MNTISQELPLKIIIAIDGSEYSLAAVRLVQDLPVPSHIRGKFLITALGVLVPREASNHYVHNIPLLQAQKMLQESGFKVETKLILGYPAEVIMEYASTNQPDLIIIGARGMRSTFGILLGGVAQQIVEYACCPILVVRPAPHGIRKLLLLSDGSSYSQVAINTLINLPFIKNTQITIVHVLPPEPIFIPTFSTNAWLVNEAIVPLDTPEMQEARKIQFAEEKRQGEKILAEAMLIFTNAGLKPNSVLLRGDAASEILKFTKENEIDLIVAGSRGLSQIQGWLLGSVSRKIVHYADCSVLIVKSPQLQSKAREEGMENVHN
jgi:nucleotide-binding universal stress UspA family protein